MAQIKGFRGIHYNLDRVDLDEVTTPPYDIIDPAAQDRYYRKNPFNIIRLDLGKTLATDTAASNRYTRAAADFADWQSQGVLVRDDQPALYVYRQSYQAGGESLAITGLICLVKLEEFGQGVLPHEQTLAGPKQDRLRLLEACRANFSQVFAVYSDQSGSVKETLEAAAGNRPALTTVDEEGVTHSLWPLGAAPDIDRIAGTLAPKRLLIADGHHRYETSLNFARAARASGPVPDSYSYIMMYLVDMANEALTILPTHRLVSLTDFSLDDLLGRARPVFKITEQAASAALAPAEPDQQQVAFGLWAAGRYFSLRADRDRLVESIKGAHTAVWKRLDTALLQEIVLGPMLGLAGGDPRLSFTQDPRKAISRVDAGAASLAFFLQPTDIGQIAAVAEAGEKMPQKSTYFYPKPRTGLIINKLD